MKTVARTWFACRNSVNVPSRNTSGFRDLDVWRVSGTRCCLVYVCVHWTYVWKQEENSHSFTIRLFQHMPIWWHRTIPVRNIEMELGATIRAQLCSSSESSSTNNDGCLSATNTMWKSSNLCRSTRWQLQMSLCLRMARAALQRT